MLPTEFFARYPKGVNAQTGDRYTVIAAVFPKTDFTEELKDAAEALRKDKQAD